jgi:hypothetical protein
MKFDPSILRDEHRRLLEMYVGERIYEPDFQIGPPGDTYLHRWHIIPRNAVGNVYLHVQTRSDRDRGNHDHPWANSSVILAGGYDESIGDHYGYTKETIPRIEGDVVHREAHHSHRLIMPEWNRLGYTITLFTTGPRIRDWGFWIDGVWHKWDTVTQERNGVSGLARYIKTAFKNTQDAWYRGYDDAAKSDPKNNAQEHYNKVQSQKIDLCPRVVEDVDTLPSDSAARKGTPIYSGVINYFPLALAAIARVSEAGNRKHNPGQLLHWSRGKSNDHLDCAARHMIDCGKIDSGTGELHDAALAWRALANLQIAEEKRLGVYKEDGKCSTS